MRERGSAASPGRGSGPMIPDKKPAKRSFARIEDKAGSEDDPESLQNNLTPLMVSHWF